MSDRSGPAVQVSAPLIEPSIGSVEIDAHIAVGGDLSGQVAVGSNIFQMRIDTIRGDGNVVNILPPPRHPRVSRRQRPPVTAPAAPVHFVGRDAELAAVRSALAARQSVLLAGEYGIGKTALLRRLAHDATVADRATVFLRAGGESVGDLAQELFEVLFVCDQPFKPSSSQLRSYMDGLSAVVFVDDLPLDRRGVELLLDTCVDCSFVAGGSQPLPTWPGRTVTLGGLNVEQLRAIAAATLGRGLTAAERTAVAAAARRARGHPLRFLQLLAAGDGQLRVSAAGPKRPRPPGSLAGASRSQRLLLAAAAFLRGGPIPVEALAACADISAAEAADMLEDLTRRGLMVCDPAAGSKPASARLAHGPASELVADLDVPAGGERLLAYYRDRLNAARPRDVAADGPTVRRLLRVLGEQQRWAQVGDLAAATESGLSARGLFDAWADVLTSARRAARMLGDVPAEARLCHQLGVRALCLHQTASAKDLLGVALGLRRSLGDEQAAGLTRYHLDLAEELDHRRPIAATRSPRPVPDMPPRQPPAVASGGSAIPALAALGQRLGPIGGRPHLAVGALALALALAGGGVLALPGNSMNEPSAGPSEPAPVPAGPTGQRGPAGPGGGVVPLGPTPHFAPPGAAGPSGPTGPTGAAGLPGPAGRHGHEGTPGQDGRGGDQGPPGPREEMPCTVEVDHAWAAACLSASGRADPPDPESPGPLPPSMRVPGSGGDQSDRSGR